MKPGHKELCIKLEDQKPSSQVDENSSVVSSEVKTVAKSNTSGEASTHCFESFFPPAIPFMTKKTVSDNNIPECAYCGTFSAFNKACARCGNTFYCSKARQAVHWKAKLGQGTVHQVGRPKAFFASRNEQLYWIESRGFGGAL
jgi:hypothetical protein